MSPELVALVRRYLLMSLALAIGGVIATAWATHDQERNRAASAAAPVKPTVVESAQAPAAP